MLTFSTDGPTADKQMRAVIFYLTTFGYIDGDFDDAEKSFVRDYVRKLVEHRVSGAVAAEDAALRSELVQKYTTHFHEVFEGIDRQVKGLFDEAVAEGEKQDDFVHAKLKLRCFEIFKGFDSANQEQLMDTIDELIQADGVVHPAEAKFRGELADLLEEELGVELLEDGDGKPPVAVGAAALLAPPRENHPFFDQFEHNYTADHELLLQQVKADELLMDQVIATFDNQREGGTGKLAGHQKFTEFKGQAPFLDGHVYVCPTAPGEDYELIVLGDLHGCYSCLKATLMQTAFFDKVGNYRADPTRHPNPKLILLGDYIDRGMFSYQGVLRSAMQIFVTAPEHVYFLRGNHEYYVEHQGKVYGAVRPSEAMSTLKPHLGQDVFAHYMKFFDAMPNMLAFERFLFVHGGLPRDLTMKEQYRDLSSLNEWDLRFEMMWSDPSSADVIPASLQKQSARFPFGRLQSQAFLQRIGCHTLVRGHEKVDEGFRRTYDDDHQLLITLFSAGGASNDDLPSDSSYRSVTPMAMVIRFKDGKGEITPLEIDYERYNDPDKNKFFSAPAEIAHRKD
ncbi:MAG: metallophosphoesterase family protein [Sorangiineae bacterium]|nr:metallophosphoesterase family protein [Polyangiaceae bacterium]MEB2322014.1 metallophosphoesterase family protein [Sorangiineae bacterium]